MKRGRFIKLMCFSLVLSLTLSFCLFSFPAHAASHQSKFNEPDYSNYSGYLNVLVEGYYSSGTDLVTYAWSVYPNNNLVNPVNTSAFVTVSNEEIIFDFYAQGTDSFYLMLWELQPDGDRLLLKSGNVPATDSRFVATYGSDHRFVGFSHKGNISLVFSEEGPYFEDVAVIWTSSDDQLNALINLSNQLNELNISLGGQLNTLITQFTDMLSKADNTNMWLQGIHNWLVGVFMPAFSQYMDTGNWYLYTIDEKLGLIHEQISQFLEMSDADREVVEQYQEQQKQQQDMLKEFTEESKLDKPDIDIDSVIDQNIDFDGIYLYGRILSAVTSHPIVVTMLLIVFTMALIAYILFGKKE